MMFSRTVRNRGRVTASPCPLRFTPADGYRTVSSALMVILGVVILVRTLELRFHLVAVLVGLGFIGLGAYRLSFVIAYLRRARSA